MESWRVPKQLEGKEIVVYGEPLFCKIVATRLGYVLIEASYDWLTALPEEYRKRVIRYVTLEEAREMVGPLFMKPVDGKFFEAKVYEHGRELPAPEEMNGVVPPVLVSEPVEWEVELRCFVLERRVVTCSSYLRAGELAKQEDGSWYASEQEREQALEFIGRLLADERVDVPAATVIDVGYIRGRGWAVVEANACWGSGVYGCDAGEVLKVLRRACVREGDVGEEDRRWVIREEIEF